MTAPATRRRRSLNPPSGFEGHVGRREAAALLGLPSEFKIRAFEKEGRLRPVRGPMGSAWYARSEVLALRSLVEGPTVGPGARPARRAPTDADVLAVLRSGPKTLVDLVVETGISITRAQRLHRFWTTHERRPPLVESPPAPPAAPPERRSPERLARATLIARLRDPDPRRRAAAFEALKPR